jgi:hypothetical protein
VSPEEAGERAVVARLKADATLTALLGSGVRIYPQWADDTLTEGDFPRLTVYTFGPPQRGPGFQRVRLGMDLWVWRSGTNGGRAKLFAIDARIRGLLEAQDWEYDDYRLYSLVGGWTDGEAGHRLRRNRDITVETSPLP